MKTFPMCDKYSQLFIASIFFFFAFCKRLLQLSAFHCSKLSLCSWLIHTHTASHAYSRTRKYHVHEQTRNANTHAYKSLLEDVSVRTKRPFLWKSRISFLGRSQDRFFSLDYFYHWSLLPSLPLSPILYTVR